MKRVLLLLTGLVFILGLAATSAMGGSRLPNSMSAMGDSMTQAVNVGFLGFGENPEHSWSTGYALLDPVRSHYERIRLRNWGMKMENAHNNAVNGARVRGLLEEQLPKTLAQAPEYVTILIGNNDACHGTPIDEFESDYRYVMEQLTTNLPDTKILLVGTPDIARLKGIVGGKFYCRFIWKTFNVCPKLFGQGADIEEFKQSVIDINNVIRQIADDFGDNVRFVSVYEYEFRPYQVSNLDCFHPSTYGQARLAQLTWEGGFYS